MRSTLPLALALALASCAPSKGSKAPGASPPAFSAGLVMLYTYPSKGASFRVEVLDGNRLRFVGTSGPMKGRGATTAYASVSIAPGIELLTWGEDNGAIMTMVIDLVDGEVHAREVRDGKLTSLDGTVEVESR